MATQKYKLAQFAIYTTAAAVVCNVRLILYNPVVELAHTLLSFKRPTRPHRTATVPIIRNFQLGVRLRQMLLLPEF